MVSFLTLRINNAAFELNPLGVAGELASPRVPLGFKIQFWTLEMGGGDFITFLDRTQDFPKMPVFRARLSLKRMTGVPLGAEPLSPRLGDFLIFFQKMVAGEATLLGKN